MDVSIAVLSRIQGRQRNWYVTPKCAVAESEGHRIILTSKSIKHVKNDRQRQKC